MYSSYSSIGKDTRLRKMWFDSHMVLSKGMPGFDSVIVVKQACSVSLTHFNQKAKLLVGNNTFRVAA